MARRRSKEPSKSRSLTARLAHLRPSQRQLSKWQREQQRERLIRIVVVAFVIVVVLVLGFGFLRESLLRGRETVADVYGQTITLSEVVDRARPRSKMFDDQIRLYSAQGLSQQTPDLISQKNRLPDTTLDQMIQEIIVRRESATRGIEVTDSEVEVKLQEILAEQDALSQPAPTATPTPLITSTRTATPGPSVTPSPTLTATPYPTLQPDSAKTAYDVLLDRNGLSDQQFRELVRSDALEEKLRAAIAADSPSSGPQVHARHILLDTREKADEVRQRLVNGEDFADLARQESKDPGSKDKGGDLGWFGSGVMNLSFELAAFSLDVGAISDPVQSQNGQHIIQVLEKSDDRPFDANTLQRKSQESWRTWISTAQVQPDVKNTLSADQREWANRQLGGVRRA
jgi:parvulin-like peptidyl-prolyl isomerase